MPPTILRVLLCAAALATALSGCSHSASPSAIPNGASKERLPIEVEKGPEDALPKKKPGRP